MLQFLKKKSVIVPLVIGVISILFIRGHNVEVSTPIVTLAGGGQLQGKMAFSREGKEFMQFLGIPYAEPPVGDLRFEPPIPLKKPWKRLKRATQYPPHCLQFDITLTGQVLGTEDCLYLNVFTYETAPKKKKPVLVYIHGGAFLQGASSVCHPSFLMDSDIVLVTLNYRVGPLGFMNTADGLIRGNMGLKDQNLALKWVQRNIGKFGGDASRVTLLGESAGAVAVHYHMLSPLSQGLIHKAISQSGVVTAPWAIDRNPKVAATNYIKSLNCPSENANQILECLKKMDGRELLKPLISSMTPTNDFLIFQPTRETVKRDDTFLYENPEDILQSGKFAKIPFMFGVTSGEGGIRTGRFDAMPELIPEIDKNWDKNSHVILGFDDLKDNTKALRQIRNKYFGEHSFTDNVHEFKKNFTSVISDSMFFEPIHRAALIHAKQGAPTYLYYFEYESPSLPSFYSVFRALRPDDWIPPSLKVIWASIADSMTKNYIGGEGPHEYGVAHGSDMLQIWNLEGFTGSLMGKVDYDFSRNLIKTIIDFVRNEEPLKFNGVVWPSIQTENIKDLGKSPLKYMLLDKEPKIIDEPFAQRLPFWESLRRDYNIK